MNTGDVTRQGIEGARPPREALTGARAVGPRRPREERMVPGAQFTSYYGKSVINPPVWKWPIAGYLFTGGLAAGSSLLAFGADVTGNAPLRRQGRYTALAAAVVSTGFLVEDLGKPSRFHHMLRVVRPTSPMSVGSWILAAYGPAAGAAAASEFTGILPRLGSLAGGVAAVFAPALASYTAVLLADTAVPVWHAERLELPFAFVGSAMAAAGGLAMVADRPAATAPARRLAVLGAAVETVATRVGRARTGEVGEVYDTGRAGWLRRASQGCTVAGAALAALLGRRRFGAVGAGALLVAGSVLHRFSVFEAGTASASDPRYVVNPQRERLRLRA